MANLEGQKAPAFTLPGSDGKKHSLADYAGKNVILWFYPEGRYTRLNQRSVRVPRR